MSGKNSAFEIYFSAKALKQLKRLNPQEQKRIKEAIHRLKTFPPTIELGKVKSRPGEYRIRVGEWRVFLRYQFSSKQVEIIAIRPRDHAYS